MTGALMEAVTKAAHNAAARLFPYPCTVDGQEVDAVLLEAWESDSEFIPGRRTDAARGKISVLKADFEGRPRVSAHFIAGDKRGSVETVSEGAAHWELGLLASLKK